MAKYAMRMAEKQELPEPKCHMKVQHMTDARQGKKP